MQENRTATVNRRERVIAFTIVALVALSLAAFIAVIVGTAVGMNRGDFATGLWPVVSWLPLVGLPLAFALIVVLLVSSATRRRSAARRGGM